MQLARPVFATDPRSFGRRLRRDLSDVSTTPMLSADMKLFATTFLAGFVFVSVLIA